MSDASARGSGDGARAVAPAGDAAHVAGCVFCDEDGGVVVWRDARLRVVIAVGEPDYPGFCRVIWNAHVTEFSDLHDTDRLHLMQAVAAVECGLRSAMGADKINVASLGNMVAHQHWHVIPRFRDDPHFPGAIWGARQRETPAHAQTARAAAAASVPQAVRDALQRAFG
jgi:diadenosine tetraphosphate (Ap4A) HIT family hydrolase